MGRGILPLAFGAQRASDRRNRPTASRAAILTLVALVFAWALQLTPATPIATGASADSAPVPKAVFIVGPTGSLTDQNLADAEKMALQAEAAGMEVRRVFFPNATWDNVLANIQGASLVVYMGHGYGWPSPYTTTLTESRQNGMGLNTFAGSGRNEYTYYGATRIRENVRLAENAVVYLNHLCYASGNGEPDMRIPGLDVARQRVDNMASGWLAVGARAVFAYGWTQKVNYPAALMNTDKTMDELFMSPADGSPKGWVGWNPARFDSVRTPGATNHLDPHKAYGYYRAVSGDLAMTAAEFRAGATGTVPPVVAPEITDLSAKSSTGTTASFVADGAATAFHPNGDGLADELALQHTVTRPATLEVTITNEAGIVVRRLSVNSPAGTSTSRWNGRNSAGNYVQDGFYTLTYVPRDSSGLSGAPASTRALVLTAARLALPSTGAFFARDGDALNKTVTFAITLNKTATITWRIVNEAGDTVRTVRNNANTSAGTVKFVWDGRTDKGNWAPDGIYRSVVTAKTNLGSYTQSRQTYAGAFKITPSTTSPVRGGKVTLTMVSTESLSTAPRVTVTQPGLQPFSVVTTKVDTRKFRVTVTLKSGGDAGNVIFVARARDKNGAFQETSLSLRLR